jgi:tRNA(fMet)-specific endonuclease VapC
MKKILLDTNGYAAFKNGQDDAVEIVRIADQIGVSSVVLGELIAGFILGTREEKNRKELSTFLCVPRVTLLMVDNETSEYYARIFQQLRRKGQPIPTNDLWIAATALQHGYTVFTYDKHFSNIENLLICQASAQLLP